MKNGWSALLVEAVLGGVLGGVLGAPVSALAVSVTRATPQGEVAQVRQVVVAFDQAVVPFGDLRQADPYGVACQGANVAGSGRWLDDKRWVYDFREAVPPGVRCVVTLKDGWKPTARATNAAPSPQPSPASGRAGAAETVSGPREFSFSTGGPAVVSLSPGGGRIEEDQHFLFRLNGPAVESTLATGAWCEVQGLGEKIPLTVVTGAVRDDVLKARRITGPAGDRVILARCARPLANGAPVRVVWGRGIAARANPQIVTKTEQRWEFEVRPAFTAEFTCERERADAPCLPIRPLSVRFSAPITRALAEQVRLQPAAGGEAIKPTFGAEDREPQVDSVTFAGSLAENATWRIVLPSGVVDDAGRPLANAASFPLQVRTGGAPPIAKFAAAPFGIVERAPADGQMPALPVTLRHVQGDLRPSQTAGRIRELVLTSDADIFAWYAKLQRFHETQVTAQEAGLPRSQWYVFEDDTDARGRRIRRQAERQVATREVSLLATQAGTRTLALPQLEGGDPRPFEVVGIPLAAPGYHVVEIESPRLGQALLDKRAPMYVRTGALVTNLGVHFKRGRENSLVWVTTLDRGRPVEGADVAVYDCAGKALFTGRTDANGIAGIGRALDAQPNGCVGDGYFVTARKADPRASGGGAVDVAFVFSGWQKGIEPWRFNVSTNAGQREADLRATTVFDRTLLRAGETVSMKHFIRVETSRGLAPVPKGQLPTRVKIVHQGSGDEFTLPLAWQGDGRSAATQWPIPPTAKLGFYDVRLERPGSATGAGPADTAGVDAGGFRVEEFRVPLVDARLVPPKGPAVAASSIALGAQLAFMSGGPMGNAPVRLTALLRDRTPAFAGYEEFRFDAPRDPKRAGPAGSADDSDDGDGDAGSAGGRLVADKVQATTDRNGAASFTLKDLPAAARPGRIEAELTYADPNGETQTVATRIDTWPSAVVLGVKPASWASVRDKAVLRVVALDTAGKPVAGQAVTVKGRSTQVTTTRKRIVGGFYAYESRDSQSDLGTLCSGSTDAKGVLTCEAQLTQAGQVELVAEAKDAQGRVAQAAGTVWVTGRDDLWFAQDNDDRIDVLAEKKRYEPGETAVFQVRMPFREATALVAVEREGVIATQVVTLRSSDPTVKLKVEPEWGPNVYVSVFVLRGRVRETPWYSLFTWGWRSPIEWWRSFRGNGRDWQAPTAMVDLAKPSFKLGVAQIEVGLAAHELQVQVTPDRPVYAVRQKASVKVKVSQGGKPMANAQVAFAAVDEGLLALMPNDSWNLLTAMIHPRGWGVETSTAQNEIIGRRHYGRKAVAAGGGGGRGGTRELFDTLLVWKPDVVLDANGEATLEVPMNDSLTSFRLVAVADADVQKFGTGSASVKVTQDLQILSGLPPLVRDGDRFTAMLTVRNSTTKPMTVRATLAGQANVPGSVVGTADAIARLPINLPPQQATLEPGAAQELQWPIDVPADAFSITWEAAADDVAGGGARDRLKVTQLVSAAVPVRVLQATIAQLDGNLSWPVQAPADALAVAGAADGRKRGGVLVSAQPHLTSALPGLRRYFELYPFICLEQKTSKAIGLRDAALWQTVANDLPTYLDRDGLASYFPPQPGDAPNGSDRLTAYVIAATDEAKFALPEAAKARMLDGLQAFVEGRIERRFWVPERQAGIDRDVRKIAALEALSRHGRATPAMLGSIAIQPNLWPTAAVIDWLRVLRRVEAIPQRAQRLAEASQILRARLTYAGTTLRFSTEESDFWWWLMDSGDSNAGKLILAVNDDPAWKDELPRLVIGHLQRQKRGAWLTTTANLWGGLALERFAQVHEKAPVAGRTVAAMGGAQANVVADWAQANAQKDGARTTLPWPPGSASLDVKQEGTGKPWVTLQGLAAVPLTAPLSAGYTLTRSVSAVERKDPNAWSRGDVLRVKVEIDAQADMTWVVLADPVPGGSTILGSGLGRDSQIAAASGASRNTDGRNVQPVFVERAFEGYRAYFEFMPRGKHTVEYTVRLNNPGRFALPPTRVEALYAPESFGEVPNAVVEVK